MNVIKHEKWRAGGWNLDLILVNLFSLYRPNRTQQLTSRDFKFSFSTSVGQQQPLERLDLNFNSTDLQVSVRFGSAEAESRVKAQLRRSKQSESQNCFRLRRRSETFFPAFFNRSTPTNKPELVLRNQKTLMSRIEVEV